MGDDLSKGVATPPEVRMKTPSGKVVPFEKWVKTMPTQHMMTDIKHMVMTVWKTAQQLGRGNTPEGRAALEQTYYMLLVLLYPVDKPLPVKNEVADDAPKK